MAGTVNKLNVVVYYTNSLSMFKITDLSVVHKCYCCMFFYRGKEKAVLVFEGVDTVSTISLNGIIIGETDNMFRRYVN